MCVKNIAGQNIAGQKHCQSKTLPVQNIAGQNINSPKASGNWHKMVTGVW
jgi:hypothetical protein